MPPKKKTTTKKRVPVKKAPKKTTARKAPAKKKAATISPEPIPLFVYRRMAITFVILVAGALIAVLYLSTMQAVIQVDPVKSLLKTEFIATALETPIDETEIAGTVLAGTLGKTKTFTASGEGAKEVPGTATGTVTIYNNLSIAQPLVKTTRLLSPEGVLFRLSKAVTVPSDGSVEAEVYADQEGASGDIEPTRFSIPGLSAARQASVYAESSDVFTGGVSVVSVVDQEELDEAAEVLRQELFADAQEMLVAEADESFGGQSFATEVTEQSFSIDAGTQTESFDVTMSLNVTGVFFDRESLKTIAQTKLLEGVGQGQEVIEIGLDEMVVEVSKTDTEDKTANILVKLEGAAIPSLASDALDAGNLIGKTAAEVEEMLIEGEIAENVHVQFFPFWLRKVPRLKDHVYIEIL